MRSWAQIQTDLLTDLKPKKTRFEVGFFRRFFLGFIGRVFLGGFFIANPGFITLQQKLL
jgi:hypothetical protein